MSPEGDSEPLRPPVPVPALPLPEEEPADQERGEYPNRSSPATDGDAPPTPGSFGGRHARRGAQAPPPVPVLSTPRLDYLPRHAVGPDREQVSPDDLTEVLARVREDPTEPPMLDRPESDRYVPPELDQHSADGDPSAEVKPDPAASPGKRVRVVLSQRKGQVARPVRTVVDVQELTDVGKLLSSNLIKSQLALTLRIAAIAVLGLGTLPVMFFFVPELAGLELFGLRLPWLLLGVAAYPFLLLLGWMYSREAERLDKIFAENVQC
jgi:hypothetical protein